MECKEDRDDISDSDNDFKRSQSYRETWSNSDQWTNHSEPKSPDDRGAPLPVQSCTTDDSQREIKKNGCTLFSSKIGDTNCESGNRIPARCAENVNMVSHHVKVQLTPIAGGALDYLHEKRTAHRPISSKPSWLTRPNSNGTQDRGNEFVADGCLYDDPKSRDLPLLDHQAKDDLIKQETDIFQKQHSPDEVKTGVSPIKEDFSEWASSIPDDEKIANELFNIGRVQGKIDRSVNEGKQLSNSKFPFIKNRKGESYGVDNKTMLCIGSRVEARYEGHSKYYPGEITQCRYDGRYDILYNDGKQELGVAKELVRAAAVQISQKDSYAISLEDDDSNEDTNINSTYHQRGSISSQLEGDAKMITGSIIEAKYQGSSIFYPGKVIRCRINGTYDILFDDGRSEFGTKREMIQHTTRIQGENFAKIQSGGMGDSDMKNRKSECIINEDSYSSFDDFNLSVGMTVEAKCGGKSNFRLGTITKCGLNETYDVRFDDGDSEFSIPKSFIRIGQNVAVMEKLLNSPLSREKYILKNSLHSQCSGENNAGINRRIIDDNNIISSVSSPRNTCSRYKDKGLEQTELIVGTSIEARYRGKPRYYPGKIACVHSFNGSYDIDYDDGCREKGVMKDMIRVLSKTVNTKSPKDNINSFQAKHIKDIDDNERVRGEHDKVKGNESDGNNHKLSVGAHVEAKYRGKSSFYPGKITRRRFDGTYDILYDDGDCELGVKEELIRDSADEIIVHNEGVSHTDSSSELLKKGSTTILRDYEKEALDVNDDRTSGTKYDQDGEKKNILHNNMAKVPTNNNDEGEYESQFPIGTQVEARYHGKHRYHAGRICSFSSSDGTYVIDYDHGEKERGVSVNMIRISSAEDEGGPTISSSGRKSIKDISTKSSREDLKEANGGGVRAHQRVSFSSYADGTSDSDCDNDNNDEKSILLDNAKHISFSKHDVSREESSHFSVGTQVEARYRGKCRYYPGKVVGFSSIDVTYDIQYEDGDKEKDVSRHLIKVLSPTAEGGATVASYKAKHIKDIDDNERERGEHDKVKGNESDGNNHTNSTSTIIEKDNCAIRTSYANGGYDDRRIDNSYDRNLNLDIGTHVEAKYKGISSFYPGKITRCHSYGTYDILYDDGEREFRAKRENIRAPKRKENHLLYRSDVGRAQLKIDTTSDIMRACSSDNSGSQHSELLLGTRVEARYHGKKRYYAGIITYISPKGGIYDIHYEDGDKEKNVPKHLIRIVKDQTAVSECDIRSKNYEKGYHNKDKYEVIHGHTQNRHSSKLCVGVGVDARYKGKSKFYQGKITRCSSDGTFDILYGDGEREFAVDNELIRVRTNGIDSERDEETVSIDSIQPSLKNGESVEARYRGKGRFYRGVISHINADGTYDIEYEDGDSEKGLSCKNVRKITTHVNGKYGGEEPELTVGIRVEARFRGGKRYYPGRIIRTCAKRRTYDIRYDDGDMEGSVSKELIRVKPAVDMYNVSCKNKRALCSDNVLHEGETVDVMFRGKGTQWKSGTVMKDDEAKVSFKKLRDQTLRKVSVILLHYFRKKYSINKCVDIFYNTSEDSPSFQVYHSQDAMQITDISFSILELDVLKAKFQCKKCDFQTFVSREFSNYAPRFESDGTTDHTSASMNDDGETLFNEKQGGCVNIEQELRLAFNFLDKKCCGLLNRREAFNLIISIGHQFTTLDEVSEIWRAAVLHSLDDLPTSLLSIENFIVHAVPFLTDKMRKRGPYWDNLLRQLLDKLGLNHKKGDRLYTTHIQKSIVEYGVLNHKDAEALFRWVDVDENGRVSWEDLELFLKWGNLSHAANYCVRQSIEKVRGFTINNQSYSILQALAGMPSTATPSILQSLEETPRHKLPFVMFPSANKEIGMGINTLRVAITSDPKRNSVESCLKQNTKPSPHMQDNNNTAIQYDAQFQIDVKRARGIPMPHFGRFEDIVKRSVRVALFRKNKGNDTRSCILSNIITRDARQEAPKHISCWDFPSSEYENNSRRNGGGASFVVRCCDRPGDNNDDLSILVELSLTMRSFKEQGFHQEKIDKMRKDVSNCENLEHREICVAWSLIPLCDIVDIKGRKSATYTLHGGTPHARQSIQTEEVIGVRDYNSTTRSSSIHRKKTFSTLEISVVNADGLARELQECIGWLPRSIICLSHWTSLLSIYRKLTISCLYDLKKSKCGHQYNTPHSGSIHPALTLFGSRILPDPILVEVMVEKIYCCRRWKKQLSLKNRLQKKKNIDLMMASFVSLVQETWFAACTFDAVMVSPPPNEGEYWYRSRKIKEIMVHLSAKNGREDVHRLMMKRKSSNDPHQEQQDEKLLFSPFYTDTTGT